jgi:predicted transcriptional regulator
MAQQKTLGKLEQRVMDFLWSNGPATAEAVRAGIGGARPLTDSTIRTVLRRLEAKRYVEHTAEDRQFIYAGVRQPRKVAAEAVRDILKRFCRGSMEELLAGMVDHRVVKSSELRRLAEKIEERELEEKRS